MSSCAAILLSAIACLQGVDPASASSVMPIFTDDTVANTLSFNDTFGHQVVIGSYNPATGLWTAVGASGGFTNLTVTGNATVGGTLGVTGITTLGPTVINGAISGTGFTGAFSSPLPIGSVAPSTGAFTTLSATSTVSGAGITALFASPPTIGNTSANTGAFTTLATSGQYTASGGIKQNNIASGEIALCSNSAYGLTYPCAHWMRLDDANEAITIGQVIDMRSLFGSASGGPNAAYKVAFQPILSMNVGSASAFTQNSILAIPTGVDLGTNHVAYNIDAESTNRSTAVGMAAGSAGINFLSGQVGGFIATGAAPSGAVFSYPMTFAYLAGGPSNAVITSASSGSTSGTSTVHLTAAIFPENGDIIRIWQGSNAAGFNSTLYNGTVTAGAGTTTVTVSPVLTANVTTGDWITAVSTISGGNTAIWNRGFTCYNSILQGCVEIYGNMEKGIEFNGAKADIGIDFAGMQQWHTALPFDMRLGSSHQVLARNAAGTADFVVWTIDSSNNFQINAPMLFATTASLNPGIGINGQTDGTQASAGQTSENMKFNLNAGASISFSNATAKDLATLTLSAGRWWCGANAVTNPAGSTTTAAFIFALNTTANTLPTLPGLYAGTYAQNVQAAAAGVNEILNFASGEVISVSTPTTIHFVAQVNFAVSTMNVYGSGGCERLL